MLRSDIGEKGVRDPFILRSRDGDKYYLIATDLRIASGISWEDAAERGSRFVIVWESEDLIHWPRERSCEIGPSGAGCVWAPEAVYDHEKDAYMVFWSSCVEGKHRIYRAYTADFNRIPDAQPSYCMHNYKVAGRITGKAGQRADYVPPVYTVNGFCVWPDNPKELDERFYGFVFQDSDFAKWIEAVAYILRQYPDEELERRADEAIDLVCRAQQPDGYLDTFYIINDMSKRFTNLRNNHELYCLRQRRKRLLRKW